jgi:small GTP-binding protein
MIVSPKSRIKAVFIGDSGVGKSSLYSRLESKTYDEDNFPTVGGSFAKMSIPTRNGRSYDVDLWDTAGQDRYKDVIPMYFERADFILAVYAVNDRLSFDHLPDWISLARDRAEKTANVIVIGNKSDLVERKTVHIDELTEFVESIGGLLGIETSAKSSAGLDLIVDGIESGWRKTLEARVSTMQLSNVELGETGAQKKPACC